MNPSDAQVPIDVLARYYRVPTGLPVDFDGREALLTASVADISANGMFIQTSRPFPPGTRLHVDFILPNPTTEIAVEVEVKWAVGIDVTGIKRSPPTIALGDKTGMGVEFFLVSLV